MSMSLIKLKSKVKNIYDYCNIDISGFAIPLKADMAQCERDVKSFLKAFATKEEASEIAAQDMVTLSCSSENPKFNKRHITVRVGLCLYSKEFEDKIIGMSVGETKTITVGADNVTVEPERVVREILPKLTDEIAERSGISHLRTAEDVRTYCRYKQYDKLLEEAADDACAYFSRELINNSDFDLDESELAESVKILSEIMKFDSMEDMECDADTAGTEDDTKRQFLASMDQMGTGMLKTAVLGQGIKELTESDYEEYLNKRVCATERPIEDIRMENTTVSYLINTYNELFTDMVEEYVLWKLKESGEAMTGETT